jgi:AhpC/TSA family
MQHCPDQPREQHSPNLAHVPWYRADATISGSDEQCARFDLTGCFAFMLSHHALRVQVFGISSDSPAANKKFKEQQNLQYDLLTDGNDILRKTFGIKKAMFVLPGRQTYVINKEGKCVMSFNDMTNTSQHITNSLQALGL